MGMSKTSSKKTITRALGALFAVVMLLTTVFVVLPELMPTSQAATAGSYKWRVRVVSENATGGWNDEEFRVYGCKNNGTSSQTSSAIASKDDWKVDFKGERTNTFGLEDQTTSEFPTKITYYYSFGGGATWRELRFYMYLEVWDYNNSSWVNIPLNMSSSGVSNTLSLGSNGGSGGNYEQRIQAKSSAFSAAKGTVTYTVNAKKPYAASVSAITGGSSSVNVPTDGTSTNYTNAFSTGTVKDQYGVNWYQDATLSVSSHTGVSLSNNKVAVDSSGNASNNYTVTVTQSRGSASSTASVTVNVFDYKVTFYDENGTTVLKATQTVDYGASATAPSNPTKSPDANKHYTFAGWTGDGYTTIKSGAQTKTVKASYTGAAHTSSDWQRDANQHWKECTSCHYITSAKTNHSYGSWSTNTATCTAAGSHYRDCACGYRQTEGTNALGHDFASQTTTSTYLKSAANCVDKAVYYYKCSRCTEKGNTTYQTGSVNANNHKTTENRAAVAATCTAGGYEAGVYCTACSNWVSGHASVDALGHDYGTASYSWNGTSSCTATRERGSPAR